MTKKLLTVSTIAFLIGCTSNPVLYPNSKLKKLGVEQSKADIKSCKADAEIYLKNSKSKQVGKAAAGGAVMGAAMGAVSGLFRGKVLEGAAEGAAVGAAGGAAGGAISPDRIKRRFVNTCLAKKGYKVIGWD